MKKIFTVLSIFICSVTFATPGDDCTTAILVSSSGCSAVGAYNNTGITGTLNPPSCFTTGTNNGMWFSFVASSVNVSITINGGTLTLPQVALVSPPVGGCSTTGTYTELACSSPGTSTASVYSNGGLTVGNTYYIYVDGQNNTTGTFQVCVASPPPPPNDQICNALTPPSITNWCSATGAYTTSGSTPDAISPTCFTPATTPNIVWFSFTATQIGGTITIDGGTSGMIPQVALLTVAGGCTGTTYTPIVCAQAPSGQTAVTVSYNFLVVGQVYYIAVSGVGGADGAYSICVNNYALTSTVPNDQCTGAIPLCPAERYYGTTAGATSTNDIPILDNNGNTIWQCNGLINNVVWYSFVATTPPQDVVLNVNWISFGVIGAGSPPYGALQFEVFDYTGPGGACAHDASTTPGYWTSLTDPTSIPCEMANAGPGSETISAASLVGGRTYYVLIDNYPGDTINFNFVATGIQGTHAGADTTICKSSPAFNLTGATPAGGTWSGPGITNASLGTFNPAILAAGSYTVYYTYGTCTDAKVITLQGPIVTCSNDVTICQGGSATLGASIIEYPGNVPVTFTNSNPYVITTGTPGSAVSTVTVAGINPNTVGTNPIGIRLCRHIFRLG